MNKDQKIREEVKRFYDDIAEGKIKTEVNSLDLYRSLGYDENLLKELPEDISMGLSCGNPLDNLILEDHDVLLDLGSGGGVDVFMARLKFPNSKKIIGIDRLPKMVERARKVASKKGFKNVEFVVGEITDMPFEDESIDKIISNCVINLEPDKNKVYSEIYRILKPGGMFIISDITLKKPLSDDIKALPNLHGTWVGGALELQDMREILKNAGFNNFFIKSEDVTDEYAKKWGYGLSIKEFIEESMFMGNKI